MNKIFKLCILLFILVNSSLFEFSNSKVIRKSGKTEKIRKIRKTLKTGKTRNMANAFPTPETDLAKISDPVHPVNNQVAARLLGQMSTANALGMNNANIRITKNHYAAQKLNDEIENFEYYGEIPKDMRAESAGKLQEDIDKKEKEITKKDRIKAGVLFALNFFSKLNIKGFPAEKFQKALDVKQMGEDCIEGFKFFAPFIITPKDRRTPEQKAQEEQEKKQIIEDLKEQEKKIIEEHKYQIDKLRNNYLYFYGKSSPKIETTDEAKSICKDIQKKISAEQKAAKTNKQLNKQSLAQTFGTMINKHIVGSVSGNVIVDTILEKDLPKEIVKRAKKHVTDGGPNFCPQVCRIPSPSVSTEVKIKDYFRYICFSYCTDYDIKKSTTGEIENRKKSYKTMIDPKKNTWGPHLSSIMKIKMKIFNPDKFNCDNLPDTPEEISTKKPSKLSYLLSFINKLIEFVIKSKDFLSKCLQPGWNMAKEGYSIAKEKIELKIAQYKESREKKQLFETNNAINGPAPEYSLKKLNALEQTDGVNLDGLNAVMQNQELEKMAKEMNQQSEDQAALENATDDQKEQELAQQQAALKQMIEQNSDQMIEAASQEKLDVGLVDNGMMGAMGEMKGLLGAAQSNLNDIGNVLAKGAKDLVEDVKKDYDENVQPGIDAAKQSYNDGTLMKDGMQKLKDAANSDKAKELKDEFFKNLNNGAKKSGKKFLKKQSKAFEKNPGKYMAMVGKEAATFAANPVKYGATKALKYGGPVVGNAIIKTLNDETKSQIDDKAKQFRAYVDDKVKTNLIEPLKENHPYVAEYAEKKYDKKADEYEKKITEPLQAKRKGVAGQSYKTVNKKISDTVKASEKNLYKKKNFIEKIKLRRNANGKVASSTVKFQRALKQRMDRFKTNIHNYFKTGVKRVMVQTVSNDINRYLTSKNRDLIKKIGNQLYEPITSFIKTKACDFLTTKLRQVLSGGYAIVLEYAEKAVTIYNIIKKLWKAWYEKDINKRWSDFGSAAGEIVAIMMDGGKVPAGKISGFCQEMSDFGIKKVMSKKRRAFLTRKELLKEKQRKFRKFRNNYNYRNNYRRQMRRKVGKELRR